MSDCQRCGGKAQLFLCPKCITTVAQVLTDLPWWLERLTEAALGQTRMSDNGGRKSARRRDLDGDAELASCIEALPKVKDDDLDKARRQRERLALAHALAAGGVNHRASELLGEISESLAYWVRTLCEDRGLPVPIFRSGTALGGPHAQWLAIHVHAIAASEHADDIAMDVENCLDEDNPDSIPNVINRPIRWWALGPCPGAEEACGMELRVPAETEEVVCRRCGSRHNVHRLLLSRKADAESTPMTRRQLVRYNGELPAEFQVPPRTLRHWLLTGRLCPCSEGDDPLYSWVDVRLLMLDSKHGSVQRRADVPS